MQNIPAAAAYIIIASASRATESDTTNMMRHAFAGNFLKNLKGVLAYESAVGYYREAGQAEGRHEQSYIIAVRDPSTLAAVRTEFCERFQQDCILQWTLGSGSVWLTNVKDGFLCELGNKGMSLKTTRVEDRDEVDAFTLTGAGYFMLVN